MNVGSLFSGGGGGDLGFINAGHNIVFGCEIDSQARSIFRYNNPGVPIFEDVKGLNRDTLNAYGIIIPEVIFGGSPCQDLSVAGKREGLGGERSGLFIEQCRIADHLGTEWLVWENVFGALSSNKGADFASVLGHITGHTPAIPRRRRYARQGWQNSGICVGPKRVAVWRVLDAQNFGVPQRRRRLFVVAGPRTLARRVIEVLFEPESGDWDTSTGGTDGDAIKPGAGTGFEKPDLINCITTGSSNNQIVGTLSAGNNGTGPSTVTGQDAHSGHVVPSGERVRKLTPLECERLMGWPDNYTRFGTSDIGELVLVSDSGRYKVCGNGIVAPVTEWIANRLPKEGEL